MPPGLAIDIEESSPVFNGRGSQSFPATVPATRRNFRLLGAPWRMDCAVSPNDPEKTVEVACGAYVRSGKLNVTEASREEGVTFNVGFDNSTVYADWQKKKLSELSGLPEWTPPDNVQGYPIDLTLTRLYSLYVAAMPQEDDMAVFPLAVNNESIDKKVYWEVLNAPDDGHYTLEQPTRVKRVIDGTVTEVYVPGGYGVTPFLRVWRVLELVFADMGLEIPDGGNPFKRDADLAKLVVLNNAADAVCLGKIKYCDLMPDCTVEEFMNALWVRFGLVYNIDMATNSVRLELIKDIIAQRGFLDLTQYTTSHEKIVYETPQYIKLSAQTSIEGAKPLTERFEDFARGLDVGKVRYGSNPSDWVNRGTPQNPVWDGEEGYYPLDPDPDNPDPDEPDPDYPDPDDRDDDYDYQSMSTRASGSAEATVNEDTFLAYQFVTGTWYKLDGHNSAVVASSSGFFNWDPQSEGLEELDLSSDDECVPVGRVSTVGLGTGNSFNDYCPQYLFGSRHYHSYIKGSKETDKEGGSTPLAFMFAYTSGGKTVGRICPETDSGLPIKCDDRTTPKLSLMFQFKDGLFATFWAGYDEILRHGNRTVEANVRILAGDLHLMDLLSVLKLRNVRCLIDTATYRLPSGCEMDVDLKLRTLQTQGRYDIATEQNVPDFGAGRRHLEWQLVSETYGEGLDTLQSRGAAIDKYAKESGYQSHGENGDYYRLGVAVMKDMRRYGASWPDSRPTSYNLRMSPVYQAVLVYDIYEVHKLNTGPEYEDWELGNKLGRVEVIVDYSMELVAKFVAD